ncbi:hypothetical protein KIH74_14075 [Kineosporia sp. J2-2]|uniref:Uncharacterized protein n=1 Tax=Kineosporia corallincola TaxID=2835133 RepID=A0ABS5TG40_9ACTN|nr:hypothetical protein [Kineosporia corallincola]MBT0770062.1 hypothetical protein [Kineosporia corallincola]
MIRDDLTGSHVGVNGFRLMPGDPLREFPATASLSTAAGDHLGLVAYTWQHPDDGPQDGLIMIWRTAEPDGIAATWGDSWYQKPGTMPLTGKSSPDGSLQLDGDYGEGWGWRILIGPGEYLLRMENVVPSGHSPAGAYPVMLLRRITG